MLQLRRFFKPFLLSFLVCVILLGAQAYGELFLPEYMSRMINVGIQQGGIERAIPEVLSEESLNKILESADTNDRDIISNAYELQDIYKLKDLSKEDMTILEQALSKPLKSISGNSILFIKTEYAKVGFDTEKLQQDYTLKIGGIMLLVSLAIMVVVVFETLIAARIAAGVGQILRKEIFNKVVGFSSAEFDKFSTASLITRSTNDIQQIQNIIVMFIRSAVYAPILATGGIIKVLNSDASMTWIIGLAVLVIILMLVMVFVYAVPKFKIIQTLVDKINLVMRETLTGMLVIRTFDTQHYELEKFADANGNLRKTNLFVGRLMSTLMPIMMLTLNLVTLLIVWVGGQSIDKGVMAIGDMMAFIQYSMQVIFSFLMFSFIAMMLPRATVAAKRINQVLTSETEVKDPSDKNIKKFDSNKKGEVVFKNVSFKYPNAEEYVLQDISFEAKAGETVAFIGGTGSGKSTIASLIPRFYDVSEGEIIVDGVNIKNVTQKDLRDKIGYVPQKSSLFSGTIETNIKFGDKEISDEDMEKASVISQAIEFIESKEDKYNEFISQGATNISGGQKQRLSIARAIARKPEIFIFDDSFSALDYKTDSKLRKAIGENLSDSTILIVGQRISTIKNANQIIVLDDGKIVGKGIHSELLKNCEIYNQIALSQLSKEELFNE